VEQEGELEGLDIFEHGSPAYHMEFGQGMTYTSPAGLGKVGALVGASPAEGDGDGAEAKAEAEAPA
jgi:hypothetical protein